MACLRGPAAKDEADALKQAEAITSIQKRIPNEAALFENKQRSPGLQFVGHCQNEPTPLCASSVVEAASETSTGL
jgi:hypothetical protein